jgi:hypothetical protein
MVKCKDVNKKMSLYIDNQLSEKDMKNFMEHIMECNKCKEKFERMKSLVSELNSIKEVDLPDDYKDKLHNRLVAEQYNVKDNNKTLIPWYLNWKFSSGLIAGILLIFMFKNQVFDIINDVDKAYVNDIKLQERIFDTFSMNQTGNIENAEDVENEAIDSYNQTTGDTLPDELSSKDIIITQTPNHSEQMQDQIKQNIEEQKEEQKTYTQKEMESNGKQIPDVTQQIKISEEEINTSAEDDMSNSTLQQEVDEDANNYHEYEEYPSDEETIMFSITAGGADAIEDDKDNKDNKEQQKNKNDIMFRGVLRERTTLDVGDSEDETVKYLFIRVKEDEKISFIEEYSDIVEEYVDRYLICGDNSLIISLTMEEYESIKELAEKISINTDEIIEVKKKGEWFEESKLNDESIDEGIKEEYLLKSEGYQYNIVIEVE